MSNIYGNGVALAEKLLDSLWLRQTVTTNNIVNVDTPDYKAQYVTFEDELAMRIKSAVSGGGGQQTKIARAIRQSVPQLRTTTTESSRLDGNNVDMVQEQVELVRSAYQYQAMVSSISNDINRLKTAAKAF